MLLLVLDFETFVSVFKYLLQFIQFFFLHCSFSFCSVLQRKKNVVTFFFSVSVIHLLHFFLFPFGIKKKKKNCMEILP